MVVLPRARCLSLLGLSPSKEQLKQIHAHMITNCLLRQPSSMGKLLECYFAVQAPDTMDHARLLFRQTDQELDDTFIWNIMIRCSPPEEALLLYANYIVRRPRTVPDNFTYTYVLRACTRLLALREGKQVHAQILKTGLASDLAIQTTAIHFYASCKDLRSARHLFDEMPVRSCVTWNAMIAGCSINNSAKEALALFCEMLQEDVKTTERTAISLLSACSQLGDLVIGSSIHAHICKTISSHQDSLFIGTGLVDMYSKCGCLSSASAVFRSMSERNVLTWSAMMAGFAIHGRGKAALELLDSMQNEGIAPNAITFTCLLSACCHAGLVEEGLHLFKTMKRRFGVVPCMQHYGCIVDLLGRVGMVEEARDFVKSMLMEPDAVVWRALLGACKIHRHVELGEEVGKILLQVEELSVESRATLASCEDYIALSNVYASAERWEDVLTLRAGMKNMGIQNKPGCSSLLVYKLDSC